MQKSHKIHLKLSSQRQGQQRDTWLYLVCILYCLWFYGGLRQRAQVWKHTATAAAVSFHSKHAVNCAKMSIKFKSTKSWRVDKKSKWMLDLHDSADPIRASLFLIWQKRKIWLIRTSYSNQKKITHRAAKVIMMNHIWLAIREAS